MASLLLPGLKARAHTQRNAHEQKLTPRSLGSQEAHRSPHQQPQTIANNRNPPQTHSLFHHTLEIGVESLPDVL
jgi:hypothetical protein